MKLTLVFLIIATSLSPWMPLAADSKDKALDDRITQFARTWKSETSPVKKRNLCIKAIDEGLFTRGSSIAIVDRLFGTHFSKDFIAPSENEGNGAVYFSTQPRQDGYNQIASVGWYLGLKWDKTRTILDYYISNLHK